MQEYYIVLEGTNGFQKEDTVQLEHVPNDFRFREYDKLEALPLSPFAIEPWSTQLRTKIRLFRKVCQLYALGKNIVYYREEY